ncbi:hypothetical protein [Sphingobacterium thalpophilum]|uniref:hypothetical protein n=1 Tax=Sphingobacterium thalpophilum TaxID=259 RepID=UPI0031DD1B40
MKHYLGSISLLFLTAPAFGQSAVPDGGQLAQPDTTGVWVQPAQGRAAMPVWGHVDGIRIGLAPLPGPRGLLRIYAPYLDYDFPQVINFIAFEPIPKGEDRRGFSELEMSSMHPGLQGKHFWSSDTVDYAARLDVVFPARGRIGKDHGEETLTVYIFAEPFDNGAAVYARIRFFASRPYEFEITGYATPGSRPLQYFIPTATMGNKARLRTLYLKDRKYSSLELWPDYQGQHFTAHAFFSQKDMIHNKKGNVYFIAGPNEANYQQTVYTRNTHDHWRYNGKVATQYWCRPSPSKLLKGAVNGRYTYWGSREPIPGGVAIENFEFIEPFENGQVYIYGISPLAPELLIKHIQQ